MVHYTKRIPVKSNIRHIGTRSVSGWQAYLLCYRPAVLFRRLRLNALIFSQEKNFAHVSKIFLFCVEIKCQLAATEVFIADLIACSTCFGHHYSHHQEFKSIIQWLLPVVFRAVVFQVASLVWSW